MARLTSIRKSGQVALRREPVAHRDADPAALGEVAHQRIRLHLLVAGDPGTARNLQQHRRLRRRRQVLAAPDVQQVEAPVRAVRRCPCRARKRLRISSERAAPGALAYASASGGHAGRRDLVAVVRPERVDERHARARRRRDRLRAAPSASRRRSRRSGPGRRSRGGSARRADGPARPSSPPGSSAACTGSSETGQVLKKTSGDSGPRRETRPVDVERRERLERRRSRSSQSPGCGSHRRRPGAQRRRPAC